MEKRKLATIQKIAEVQPIENADAIEKVKVKDWWCVTRKDEFKVGDLCVYFEIDSLLPVNNPAFEFLAKATKPKNVIIDGKEHVGYGYRLKTIKLRGQISQGLALQLSVFPVLSPYAPIHDMDDVIPNIDQYPISADISEELGIVKYELPIPAHLSGKVKGAFPGFIPKTDEERVQNLGEVIDKLQGETFYITEKLDGSSATFYKKDGEFGVCSRNLELIDTPENTLWGIARRYNLANIIADGYVIQGEIIGEGIQKNSLKQSKQDIYVFNVYNINELRYLDFEEFVDFCDKSNLKTVPIVEKEYILDADVNGLLNYAEGKSRLNSNVEREGIVLRPLKEKQVEIDGILTRLSFKAISNKYLLKHE